MLVMPLDRITRLLDLASSVEEDEPGAAQALDEGYQDLIAALDSLSDLEIAELLALASFGEQQEDDASWELAQQVARGADLEAGLDTLLRALLFSETIETALDRLGVMIPESQTEEEESQSDAGSAAG